jgi:UDP-N-acetylglucosamine 4,6-dehydratase
MTRFFWEVQEAVEFTLSSVDMMRGGEVFIPKIKAKRIVDVAREIAPHLPHRVIGIRGGEKLHETLISEDESRMAIELPDRYVIQPADPCWNANHLLGKTPVADGFRYTSETALAPMLEAAE